MNQFYSDLVYSLLRSSLVLSISAILVPLLLHWLQVTSLPIRRMAYFVVLLQGCLLIRIPMDVNLPQIGSAFETDTPLNSLGPEVNSEPVLSHSRLADDSGIVVPVGNDSLYRGPLQPSRKLWAEILLVLWMAGILVLVARLLLNILEFRRRFQDAGEPLEEWTNEWRCLLRNTSRHRSVRLRVTPETGPLLCWLPGGYQLLVPETLWAELNTRQRTLILQHELAHLHRADLWKSLVVHLMALVQWFNPLVWLMVRRFDREAEWACDESVREADPECAPDYARTLLRLGSTPIAALLTTQAAGGHGLADRIRRLVVSNPRKDSNMKKLAIVTFVLGFAAIPMLQIRAHAEDASANAAAVTKMSATQVTSGASTSTGTNESSQAATDAGTEAVLDLKQLFDGLNEIRDEKSKIVAQMKEKQASLEEDVRQLEETRKNSPKDTAKYKEQQDAMIRRSAEMRSQLSHKESVLYTAFCKQLSAEIPKYASENGIGIVRRKGATFGSLQPGVHFEGLSASNSHNILMLKAASGIPAEVSSSNPDTGVRLTLTAVPSTDGSQVVSILQTSSVGILVDHELNKSLDERDESLQLLNQDILFGEPVPARDITQDLTDHLNSQYREKKADAYK